MSINSAAAPNSQATQNRRVAVFGAYGHTGRFVIARLRERGWVPVACGRDAERLVALDDAFPGIDRFVASVDDPASLDRALAGTVAVINCAGPFSDTAVPVVEAALRAKVHYLDTVAEQQPALALFERYDEAAKAAGIVIVPAMAFYGGLADLLATSAMGDWDGADEILIAVGLDSWHPTNGTRVTGERNKARRVVVSNGALDFVADPAPTRDWAFQAPFGNQEVVGVPLSEIVLISKHLRSSEVHSFLNLVSLKDVRDPTMPAPVAADSSGRSAQVFLVEVMVRKGEVQRHASAQGRDIYAVSAPLIVEAMERVVDGRRTRTGTVAAGEAFDAPGFLAALAPEHLVLA